MKNTFYSVLCCMIIGIFAFSSCNEVETFAEKKDKERDAINQYISEHNIKVITESQFHKQDSTTDVSKNEYVLFENTGVYMQIVRKGAGDKLRHGKAAELLIRFDEWNIMGDSLQMSNRNMGAAYMPEVVSVYNSYGVFTASFVSGLMAANYGAYVPPGWLVPLTYINIGRQTSSETEIAHVKIIVPADQGHESASSFVCPFHYELYIQRN